MTNGKLCSTESFCTTLHPDHDPIYQRLANFRFGRGGVKQATMRGDFRDYYAVISTV